MGARRRKARAIRRSVLAFAVASFIAAWALIYGQMVTGKDPVLTKKTTHGSTHHPASSTRSSTQAPSTSSNPVTPSPVTTSQS
jgi:hypothetical protein